MVEDGYKVHASIIASQMHQHAIFGGVVPEIAARAHLEQVDVVVDQALAQARLHIKDIDAIAVTAVPA